MKQQTNNCGCCDGLSVQTPLKIQNRPGLTAISYRVGTYKQFRNSLLANLSLTHRQALQQLTTRSDDDFTIALLDSWAIVADVLTFYQERIANESYLNTAIEQLSLTELAYLIGYKAHPGLAATTYLAFTVDDAALTISAPIAGIAAGRNKSELIHIDTGVKVQSIPRQDEQPQLFETVEKIEAKADWNAMKLRMTEAQVFDVTEDSGPQVLYVDGVNNNLRVGDWLYVSVTDAEDESSFIDLMRIYGLQLFEDHNVTQIVVQEDNQVTIGRFSDLQLAVEATGEISSDAVYDLNTINSISYTVWRIQDINELIRVNSWDQYEVHESLNSVNQNRAATLGDNQVRVFRNNAPVFGYNAPLEVDYASAQAPPTFTEWQEQESNNTIYLDSEYKDIVVGSWVAVQDKNGETKTYQVTGVQHTARTAYGMSGKTTKLTIAGGNNWWGANNEEISVNLRSITVYFQSEALMLSEVPLPEVIPAGEIQVDLNGSYLELKAGQAILFSGEVDGKNVYQNEIKILSEVYLLADNFTRLVFDSSLEHNYLRQTVTINGNVALATHGETVEEVLGGGDARIPFQRFTLKHTPLTYTSAATPTGIITSLEIRVNDILWKEVPSLYGVGPTERVYTTQQDSQAVTTVIFGDGTTGARLPSGQQNVRAKYRKGIGSGGLLKADQLSMLMTRPLGVKAVTNPLLTIGAQDPEQLSDIRRNANLSVYTLNRIVSLQDYEDFARAFAGIKKAKAVSTWQGMKEVVHLTLAGENGAAVEQGNPIYKNLLNAIGETSVEGVAVNVVSYKPLSFKVNAKISVDSNYQPDLVLTTVSDRLNEYYSFANRDFGQHVALSEVSLIISQVEGVVFVDVDVLDFVGGSGRNDLLEAEVVKPYTEDPFPAELLTISISAGDFTLISSND